MNQGKYESALSKAQDIVVLLDLHLANKTIILARPNDTHWLSNRLKSLKNHAFSIIVAGGFNSGKSTLINALIEHELLHDGATPTTAVITRLTQGVSYQAKLVYKSGKEELLDWSNFINRKITDFENTDISTLDICVPYQVLAPGVEIIDTPGLNEHGQRTRLVLDHLPNADAIIMVVDAVQPLRRDDVEFIKLLGRPPLENVFFVTNRMGLINNPIARKDVSQHIRARLSSFLKQEKDTTGNPAHPYLFFTDAKAALSLNAPHVKTEPDEPFDFYRFREELQAFLNIENQQDASAKALAKELAELCYRIEQGVKSAESTFESPLAALQQKYTDSQEKAKAIQEANAKVAIQIARLGQDIGEQIYTNLLSYISQMEKTWPNDVKELDLSKLEKLNVLSVKISHREKTLLSEILSVELKRYLDLKLLQWMQQLPDAISPVLENLSYKVRTDLTTMGLRISELETSLTDGDNASQEGVSDTGQPEIVLLSVHNLIGNSIKDVIKWPFFEDISKSLKNPDVVKTVGFSTLGAILAAGAALLGANPVGIFLATLGAGLIDTLRTRHEQREFYRIMREESSSESAYRDLGKDKISEFHHAVRTALEEETGKFFFYEIKKQIIGQKLKIIDGVTSELQVIAKRMQHTLDGHMGRIMEQHKQVLDCKKVGERAIAKELEHLKQFNLKLRKLFDEYYQLVFNNAMSDEEIEAIGKARANYIQDYIRIPDAPLSINIDQFIPTNESPETLADHVYDKHLSSTQAIQRHTESILLRILGLEASPNQLLAGYKETAQAKLDQMVGIQNVKESIKELMHFQATQARRRREGKQIGEAPSLHLVFTGNPGTGKTTVAKIIGEMYYNLNLLKRGHTIEVKAGDLIAGFVGQTSGKTREKIELALDGVLFIDEAYSLVPKNTVETNFGKDVIAELLGAMEMYNGRLVVIVAGYHDEIQHFLDADPGLRGRFPSDNHFHFQDYSPEELYQILTTKLSKEGWSFDEVFEKAAKEVLNGYCEQKAHEKTFENARYARSFAESLIRKVGSRINRDCLSTDTPISIEDISTAYNQYRLERITEISVPKALDDVLVIKLPEPESQYPIERERQKISNQEKVQKDAVSRQTHTGTGDNVYGNKIVYEMRDKTVSRKLTLIPDAETKVFFGHTEVIKELKTTLALHRRVLLQSIGGRGKTSLAIQFINKHTQDDFQHIAWLSCKTTIMQAFLESTELLNQVGIAFKGESDENSRFHLLQSKLVEQIKQTTLIVIDNVEKKHEEELSQLSLSHNFKILLTSRERINGFEPIELPVLDFEAAQAIFCKVSGREKSDLDDNLLKEFFRLSDYHVTVIETLAKKFLTSYGQTLEIFTDELKRKNISNSITELLKSIIDTTALNGQEQTMMRYFSILPSAYIQHKIIQDILGFEVETLNITASSLIDKGLLDEDKTLGFKCQQIIQEAIRSQLKPDIHNCADMLQCMGEKLADTIAVLNYRQLHSMALHLLPLLQSVVSHIDSEAAPFNHIFKNLGFFSRVLGDFEQAKIWIKKSLAANNNAGSLYTSEPYAEALQIYADICLSKGDYEEAEDILNNHIRHLQTEAPQTSKDLGLAYERLGMLHLKKGNLAEALENLREAVEVYEKLGEDNMTSEHIAHTSTNIGLALINIGSPNEAKDVLEEAGVHYEKVKDALGLGHVYHYLSITHIALGEFHKANSFLKRAKQYLSTELPEDDIIFAEFINNSTVITANSFLKEDSNLDKKDIETMLEEQIIAIRILERHRPEGHSDFALYYFNLARLYNISGDTVLARHWAFKSIDVLKQNSEDGRSLNLANFYFMVATQLSDIINERETEEYLMKAIETLPQKEDYKGQLAAFFLTLGAIYATSENYRGAIDSFKKSYDTYRQVFPQAHPVHAFTLHCLATCRRMSGKYPEALHNQQEVLDICKRLMPETDPDMAFSYAGMALIHAEMKNYKDALIFCQKASRVNDGSTDLSELNNIGHIGLVKYPITQYKYYAYVIIPPDCQYNDGSILNDGLIVAKYTSLEDAIKAQPLITHNFGHIKFYI